jgi:hypothetical protein
MGRLINALSGIHGLFKHSRVAKSVKVHTRKQDANHYRHHVIFFHEILLISDTTKFMSLKDTDPEVANLLAVAAARIKDRTELWMVFIRLGKLAEAVQFSYSHAAGESILNAVISDSVPAFPAEHMP